MQSAWHNLPTFDGVQQLPGAEYAAREVSPDKNSITGELAGAYPPIPGLGTYRRRVSVREQGITLRDETDYPGTVELTLDVYKRQVRKKLRSFTFWFSSTAMASEQASVSGTVPMT